MARQSAMQRDPRMATGMPRGGGMRQQRPATPTMNPPMGGGRMNPSLQQSPGRYLNPRVPQNGMQPQGEQLNEALDAANQGAQRPPMEPNMPMQQMPQDMINDLNGLYPGDQQQMNQQMQQSMNQMQLPQVRPPAPMNKPFNFPNQQGMPQQQIGRPPQGMNMQDMMNRFNAQPAQPQQPNSMSNFLNRNRYGG